MPTNVPPQYREVEARFRAAESTEEKIALLEEMIRILPKHKGTDRLHGDLKAKLAKLRKEPGKKSGASGPSHLIPREGAGQVALVGPPNGGKSSLVAVLTHATPRIAEYPFTTREPVPGMMAHEDVGIQLLDLPPLSREHVEPWVFDCIRRADLVWLVADDASALDGVSLCLELCAPKHLGLEPPGSPAREDAPPGWMAKKTLLVATGRDRPGSAENAAILRELLEVPWPLFHVSAVTGEGLDALRAGTFEALDVVRVYTKEPGKPPDRERPFTLDRGATVEKLAEAIHKDLLRTFKFARIWGSGAFDGQEVQRDHVLRDGDVVELHA